MFDRFTSFAGKGRQEGVVAGWGFEDSKTIFGLGEFATLNAGKTFFDGKFRVLDQRTGSQASEFIKMGFPELYRAVVPFAYDWLGRVFAADVDRKSTDARVLIVEPGAAEYLQADVSFKAFIDRELVDYADDILATNFWDEWRQSSSGRLTYTQCAGYRVPLFLGGEDAAANLATSELSTYWPLLAQLRQAVTNTSPGEEIGAVTID